MFADSIDHSRAISVDIKRLGGLLGQIIREQHGQEALDLVEEIRAIAKARRNHEPQAAEKMMERLSGLSLEQKKILIKAFSNYFQLINIAEDRQRIRILRERERQGQLTEHIDEAIRQLKQKGLNSQEVRELLGHLRLRFVLTAHPSEAKRNEVLVKLRHIAQMMEDFDRAQLLPREEAKLESILAEEIEELWQTRQVRAVEKRVSDEVEFGLYFITSVIMDSVVSIYDDIYESMERHYPEEDWSNLHRLLRYGSWIGGDRDGNPNVTDDVTLETLQAQRDAARRVYLQELDFLEDHLTQSTQETGVSEELVQHIMSEGLPGERYADELYREALSQIRRKLEADRYFGRLELLDDLRLVRNSLRAHKGRRVAEGKLRRLIRKVRLFGLVLAPLDIREDARLHAAALDEIFRAYDITSSYRSLSEEEKQALLTREIQNPRPFFPPNLSSFSETTRRVVRTWRMIATAHERFSPDSIDTVIASMSQQPSDVLALLLMAKEVGVAHNLDLVPLFETIEDLDHAPQIMTALFNNPVYRAHLEDRRRRQQIMIGYSDSGKDGGYIASNWYLYTAQQRLAELCAQYGIETELFHGRGGSIGRGGGPANRAILSQPPMSLRGGIKITEQGEVIAYRYMNQAIAQRHLHQVLSAVMLALGNAHAYEVRPEWVEAMQELADLGREAFRKLVYETEDFLDYWQQATPIHELSQLRISSRPARRSSKGGFSAMRAIPWVFSWMQSRAIIPSWYGVGYAFSTFCQRHPHGLDLLRVMYKDWLFFRALVENTQFDVAKADMPIAELYASLVDDEERRTRIFGQIRSEHELSQRMICAITEQAELLDKSPTLKISIERRNPYVDPLNFLQVDLLRRLRAMTPQDESYQTILNMVLDTVNGIAAGLKTTG
ncbi:MAG: phosphoenolpyruvate carboxylase [Anaerolineae bacterium]|nr:phosphoenolpyruvate carboxylase [Anaerolineae bacterium]MDW8173573.1 phosphoenolpyruvate carboxylase [Anaerolineae bacterium]